MPYIKTTITSQPPQKGPSIFSKDYFDITYEIVFLFYLKK
jgi:hypothetical protein